MVSFFVSVSSNTIDQSTSCVRIPRSFIFRRIGKCASKYDTVKKCYVIRKDLRNEFVTAYNNIPLHWYAEIRRGLVDDSKLEFYVYYNNGAPEKIDGLELEIGVIKTGDKRTTGNEASTHTVAGRSWLPSGCVTIFVSPGGATSRMQMTLKETKRGFNYGWTPFEDNNLSAVRNKYGMNDGDRMVYQLTVKIPVDTFSFVLPTPTPKPSEPFLVNLFGTIDDPSKSSFSDAKLISCDDIVYHCHKCVIGAQSKPLATMFRDPLATKADGDQQHPSESTTSSSASSVGNDQSKKKNKGEYDFPTMTGASLKSMIEHLYTGNATMVNLTVAELLEVADSAEQYALKPLKESCGVEMWKRVVNDPQSACQIVSFAHLHDMKWLKYRGLDVIASLPKSERRTVVDQFGEDLRNDFDDYLADRLLPYVNLAGRHPY